MKFFAFQQKSNYKNSNYNTNFSVISFIQVNKFLFCVLFERKCLDFLLKTFWGSQSLGSNTSTMVWKYTWVQCCLQCFFISAISYLAAPRPTMGHWPWGKSPKIWWVPKSSLLHHWSLDGALPITTAMCYTTVLLSTLLIAEVRKTY